MAEKRKFDGFYYDEDKKKYFKILPTHVVPKEAKYSINAARKERQRERELEAIAEHEQQKARFTVKRSRLLGHPLAASIALSRELGQLSKRGSRETAIKSTWALAIGPISLLDFGDSRVEETDEILSLDDITRGVSTLLKDEATGTVIAGGSRKADGRLGQLVSWAPNPGDGSDYTVKGKCVISCEHAERMTTLCLSLPTRTLVSSSYDQDTGNMVTMTQLKDPSRFVDDPGWPRITEGVSVRCRLGREVYNIVTSCAVGPPGRFDGAVALATGQNFFLITLDAVPIRNDFRASRPAIVKDILAVAFLSDSLLAAGCRNGSLWLHDMRSDDKVHRLQSPSAITHIRAVDGDNKVLVAGMQDHMHMYDLRFAPVAEASEEATTTKPCLSYPAYRNSAFPNLGLAFSKPLGLVAAATEERRIVLFDVWTGKVVEAGFEHGLCRAPVQCLSFVGEVGELDGVGDGRSLLVGDGNVVEEWGWRRPRYDCQGEGGMDARPTKRVVREWMGR